MVLRVSSVKEKSFRKNIFFSQPFRFIFRISFARESCKIENAKILRKFQEKSIGKFRENFAIEIMRKILRKK